MVTNLSIQRLNDLNCVLGLDCSKYQNSIDWEKVKNAGIKFAFIKITEGNTYSEDEIYDLKDRIFECQKNDIKIGYYHFARPGDIQDADSDANKEVVNVLNHLKILPKPNFPIVIDIESYAINNFVENKIFHLNTFLNIFISELKNSNYNAIVYSYKSFIDVNTNHLFGSYPLWLAAYLNDPEHSLPNLPVGWNEWKIWQFTEQGKIDGYVGNIDLDIMRKEYFDLF